MVIDRIYYYLKLNQFYIIIFTLKHILDYYIIIIIIMLQIFTNIYEYIFGKTEDEPKFAKPDGYKNINTSSTKK